MPTSISGDRKSRMNLHEVYFWTNSIKDWKGILWDENNKIILVDSLRYLALKNRIKVYAFIIMPNHIHLVWKLISLNGKELPNSSFSKYTSHQIIENLKSCQSETVDLFRVNESDRKHRIWHRDPLAAIMDSRDKVEQKITYIHENPLVERWSMVKKPEDYYWSSARFYETGIDHFGFLTHYMDEF